MRTFTRGWMIMALFTSSLAVAPAACDDNCGPDTAAPDLAGRAWTTRELAELAVLPGPLARAAQVQLRTLGPAGLVAFESAHAAALDAAAAAIVAAADAAAGASDPAGLEDPERARLLAALDAVCAQRDCVLSRLFWHTDLDEAVRRATAEGKPILSLRLLGRLDEELSCANSRFFRALLYPNPALAELLRQRFVLHWSSERPAPKLTIDLGEGRSVTTTITGNSAHFVLDPAGRPVDVIPGLVAPESFIAALTRGEQIARETTALHGPARQQALARLHLQHLMDLDRDWQAVRRRGDEGPRPIVAAQAPAGPAPRAGLAAPIAISKARVEVPLLQRLDEPVDLDPNARLGRLADAIAPTIALAPASRGLMRVPQGRRVDPARDAEAFAAAEAGVRQSLAQDTLRNEFELHRQIHAWWTVGDAAALDLAALTRRVYSELFLTPRSDPWLGLADPTTYSGLVGAGRRVEAEG